MVRSLPVALAVAVVACGGQPSPGHDEPAGGPRLSAAVVTPLASIDSTSSLREVLQSRALVGRSVRVAGRCIAPAWAHELGQPPRLVRGWQLEADGVAVFVIGALPPACGERSDTATLTITALVAEDSLPAIGDLPPSPRRYLVLLHVDSR